MTQQWVRLGYEESGEEPEIEVDMRLGAMMAVYLDRHGGAGGFPLAFSRERPPAARWGCVVPRGAWRRPAIWPEKVWVVEEEEREGVLGVCGIA